MSRKRIFRIVSMVMLLVALVFLSIAFSNPQAGLPRWLPFEMVMLLYLAYLAVMLVLFFLSHGKE